MICDVHMRTYFYFLMFTWIYICVYVPLRDYLNPPIMCEGVGIAPMTSTSYCGK